MFCFNFVELVRIVGLQCKTSGEMPDCRKTAWRRA